jgi:uncharacterized protein YecE (DUF72 family)
MAGRIVIGTSSWADPGFVEEWYPPGLPARERLPWYAERFEAVEVNSTFYAVPERRAVGRWAAETPGDFTFDVKLHRLQLSPAFGPRDHDLDELAPLVERLRATAPVAVELRHRFWLDEHRREDTLQWYERHGAAFVCVDGPEGSSAPTIMPHLDAVTRDDVAYLRAHGRNLQGYLRGLSVAERFAHHYADEELRELGERAHRLAEEAGTVHVMFNNNRGADAPVAAQRMRELLGQEVAA